MQQPRGLIQPRTWGEWCASSFEPRTPRKE